MIHEHVLKVSECYLPYMTDINISVKRLVSSCSSFKAQENGNSWSIFNIFRHLHVCVALNNVNGERRC